MNREEWEKEIISACEKAGTYAPQFEFTIRSLAEILEKRDEAEAEYQRLGAQPIVKYTNKGGATNPTKNPALILWDDLSKTALSYWRDLGLTPKGYHALMGDNSFKKEKKSTLATVLSDLGV